MSEFKLDTGSDGNPVAIRMYKTLFLQTNIDESNKTIKVLCTYNNSCIPQMGICQIAIVKKGISMDAASL